MRDEKGRESNGLTAAQCSFEAMSHTVEPYSSLSPMLYPVLSLSCCSAALKKKKVPNWFRRTAITFSKHILLYLDVTPSLPTSFTTCGQNMRFSFWAPPLTFLVLFWHFFHGLGCVTVPLAADLFTTWHRNRYLLWSAVPPYFPLDCFLHGWPLPLICLHQTLFSASSPTLRNRMSSLAASIHAVSSDISIILLRYSQTLFMSKLWMLNIFHSLLGKFGWPKKRHSNNNNKNNKNNNNNRQNNNHSYHYCFVLDVVVWPLVLSTIIKKSHWTAVHLPRFILRLLLALTTDHNVICWHHIPWRFLNTVIISITIANKKVHRADDWLLEIFSITNFHRTNTSRSSKDGTTTTTAVVLVLTNFPFDFDTTTLCS